MPGDQVTSTELIPGPAGNGLESRPADTNDLLAMLSVDFAGVYSVNVAAAEERLRVLRLSLTFLSAPFLAGVALASAGVFQPDLLGAWRTIPGYLYLLVLGFGLLSIVPFLRFVEVNGTHMRTARAINNFRLLYSRGLAHYFDSLGWKPNLPVDPTYPETYAPLGWAGVNVMVLGVLNSTYIGTGVVGLSIAEPSFPVIAVVTLGFSLAHFLVYYIRSTMTRRNSLPLNLLGAENVEI